MALVHGLLPDILPLIYAVPAGSMVVSAIWLWLRARSERYREEKAYSEFQASIVQSRQTLQAMISDEKGSEDLSLRTLRTLEEMDLMYLASVIERSRTIYTQWLISTGRH